MPPEGNRTSFLHPPVVFVWQLEELEEHAPSSTAVCDNCLRCFFFLFLFLPAQVYVTSICFCMHQFVCNNMQKQWSHCDQSGPRPSFLVQLAITVSVSLQLLCASTCLKLSYGRVALSGLVHQGSSGATRKRTYHISKLSHCWDACTYSSNPPPPRCFTRHCLLL